MKTALKVLLAAGIVLAMPIASASAQEPSVVVDGPFIRISSAAIVKSLDTQATVVYFVDGRFQIVQLHCSTRTDGLFGIDVGPCHDSPQGAPVDLVAGGGTVPAVPAGTTRIYRVTLKSLQLGGALLTDLDVAAVAGGSPVLQVSTDQEPFANRRQITIVPNHVPDADAVLRAIASARERLRITYIFPRDDPEPSLVTDAVDVVATPADRPTALIITPAVPMPRRPRRYAVRVEVPVAASGVPAPLFPPGTESLAGVTLVEFLPAAVDRASSEFFFEVSYTSTVDAASDERANVGVFALHIKPTFAVVSRNVDGRNDGAIGWWAIRPLLDADVDTRPAALSRVPNRILLGVDHDWGWDLGVGAASAPDSASNYLRQFILTNGLHYESDRDFELQTAFWHVEFRPVFRDWEQTRDQRALQFSRWVLAQLPNTVRRKQPRVSAYYIRPSIAYDLGGVVRDRNDVQPYENDTITRTPFRLDAGIEFLRTLVFAVTDDYHVIWNLDEDRGRNYFEARVELNTGVLFRLDRNSLQHAITMKYQKGRQSPVFSPVDTLSIGVRLFR